MRKAVLAALITAVAPSAGAAPLDEALHVVMAAHPVIQAEEARLDELARKSDWQTEVSLGWTQRGTVQGGAAGANAGVRVTIPLFDRSHEREVTRERAAVAGTRQEIRAGFVEAVRTLREQAAAVESAKVQRDFARDRLEYRRKQVDEGLLDPAELWPAAESSTQAEQAYQGARDGLEARTETVARRYGGREWERLRLLLVEHLRRNVP